MIHDACEDNDSKQEIRTKAIITLLKHYNIVSEITSNEGNNRSSSSSVTNSVTRNDEERPLFMPCLLLPYPEPQDQSGTPQTTTVEKFQPAPLLFTFQPYGYPPMGLFYMLIAKLVNKSSKFRLKKERYRNKISFTYGRVQVQLT